MTGPARTNTTAAAEVLRRQVLRAVAGKCVSDASAEAATDAVMDVIAGLWGVACDIHDIVRRTVTDWTPAEEGEHG